MAFKRHVQFIFDDKMVDFAVEWSQEDVDKLLAASMEGDGYAWVPRDEERGTGAFINIARCTNIKLVDFEYEDEAEDAPLAERCSAYLDSLEAKYDVRMDDSVLDRGPSTYLPILLAEKFGLSEKDAEWQYGAWAELR